MFTRFTYGTSVPQLFRMHVDSLADRYRTKRVLTLDHRHFGVVRPLSGGRFTLLP